MPVCRAFGSDEPAWILFPPSPIWQRSTTPVCDDLADFPYPFPFPKYTALSIDPPAIVRDFPCRPRSVLVEELEEYEWSSTSHRPFSLSNSVIFGRPSESMQFIAETILSMCLATHHESVNKTFNQQSIWQEKWWTGANGHCAACEGVSGLSYQAVAGVRLARILSLDCQ